MRITRTAVLLDYEGDTVVIAAMGRDGLARALKRFGLDLDRTKHSPSP